MEEPAPNFNEIFSLRRPKDAKAGFSSGMKSLGKGVVGGVVGLIAAPVVGATQDGFKGFAKGVATGGIAWCIASRCFAATPATCAPARANAAHDLMPPHAACGARSRMQDVSAALHATWRHAIHKARLQLGNAACLRGLLAP